MNADGATRRALIADLLRERGALTTDELGARLRVSRMTVRRDLESLARAGLARRTHGGAVLPTSQLPPAPPAVPADAARRRAEAAARGVVAGETVFLDSSPLAYVVACVLAARGAPVTVLTNGMPAMDVLARHAGTSLRVIGVGGRLDPGTRSFVGPDAVRTVEGHFAERAFLGTPGSADPEVTDAMAAHADRVVRLA